MSFLDLVRQFDIADYLSQYGRVARSGGDQLIATPCPLCGDKRKDKFYVRTGGDKHGLFNSYCCHEEGKLVDLVSALEEISGREAAGFIARTVSGEEVQLQPLFPPSNEELAKRDPLLPSPLSTPSAGTPCWVRDHVGQLQERGVNEDVITRHALHLTGNQTLYDGKRREDLDNRLIIPVYDSQGALWGWQGRDLSGQAARKYVFPSGDRSTEYLYALPLHRGNTLMIVEGVFHKWAWDTLEPTRDAAVASFGKKLTADQIQLILAQQHVTDVVIAWDLDAAREIAKAAERLEGFKRVWVLPAHDSGRDHDELSLAERKALLGTMQRYDRALAVRLSTGF